MNGIARSELRQDVSKLAMSAQDFITASMSWRAINPHRANELQFQAGDRDDREAA